MSILQGHSYKWSLSSCFLLKTSTFVWQIYSFVIFARTLYCENLLTVCSNLWFLLLNGMNVSHQFRKERTKNTTEYQKTPKAENTLCFVNSLRTEVDHKVEFSHLARSRLNLPFWFVGK